MVSRWVMATEIVTYMFAPVVRPLAASYTPPAREREHYPQLDGLRALAIALVILAHTMGSAYLMLGDAGVTLFFVLSSFLITGILLRATGTLGHRFRVFYARRALRIAPAYALLLVVLLVADVPDVRDQWAWHALYLTNWLTALTGAQPQAAAHFWTLAIEEQFYLAWPLLCWSLPSRHLGRVCVALATLAVVCRGMLATVVVTGQQVGSATFTAFDAFAIGALLAWCGPMTSSARRWTLCAGALLTLHAALLGWQRHGWVLFHTTQRLGFALLAVWAIDRAVADRLPAIFAWRPVRIIGMISYGIYLWHFPIAWAVAQWVSGDPIAKELARGSVAKLLLVSALTLPTALLSWYAIERPLNRLKRFFPYHA